ncbi:hypothetical protein KEM54_000287 [Ascosphaera aggregata]|nr:hypothetical protein KEM54_000287 [Ascosphaera aggregata]
MPGIRPSSLSFLRLYIVILSSIPKLLSSPLPSLETQNVDSVGVSPRDTGATFYVDISVAAVLVLVGGCFAGLTIALMGQDSVNLQVIAKSGEPYEQRQASTVLRLLARGKHWVLVTLLLGNVVVNEALPIVLDRSLGGGWLAVVGSTVLIVIFGEVIPQSVCVRYGLAIGASLAPVVLILMYLFAPVAYPTAKLLDHLLGEDHGTLYKKAGLKTLITLHKALGQQQAERLNQDEVTIIQSVLELKDKTVGSIMTPMKYVFTLSRDAVLDEKTMDHILSAGYSRVPIHSVDNPLDFEGMLLVKTLITYDPEDAMQVKEFALATLPETKPETSCLDILNYFQEGQSHMVLVSTDPAKSTGAVGVVTLEDVIEELIGEYVDTLPISTNPYHSTNRFFLFLDREIIDESDIFIDNTSRVRRKPVSPSQTSIHPEVEARATRLSRGFSTFAKNLRLRRAFSAGATTEAWPTPQPLNNALNPKSTKYGNVKIKQRQQSQPEAQATARSFQSEVIPETFSALGRQENERTPLLGSRPNGNAS